MSALPIITADQRLAERRGIKGCIFGKSGIGKTSLLWTLEASTTLFLDLEAGDPSRAGRDRGTGAAPSRSSEPYPRHPPAGNRSRGLNPHARSRALRGDP